MEELISLRDLFKKGFDIYLDKFWIFVRLVLVDMVIFLAGIPLGLFLAWSVSKNHAILSMVLLIVFLVYAGFALIVVLLVQIGMIVVIKEHAVKLSTQEYLKKGWEVVASFAWISLLAGLIIFAGLIFFIIPGVLFSIWFAFAKFILVFTGKKGWPAVVESKNLVKGYWWAVFGRFLLLALFTMALSFIPVIGRLMNLFFALPFGLIYSYLMYEDLRRIKQV